MYCQWQKVNPSILNPLIIKCGATHTHGAIESYTACECGTCNFIGREDNCPNRVWSKETEEFNRQTTRME